MGAASRRAVGTVVAIGLLLAALVPAALQAAELDPAEQRLADRHSPILMLQEQVEECDSDGEAFEPMDVELLLGNPQILLRQVGESNPVILRGPDATDIAQLGEGFYLDFPGDALSPGCIYERDFRRYASGRDPVVYAHVASQPDAPGKLALQYWFYWYYNDWNNKHEGDWEGIQLLFDASTAEEALRTDPVSAGYAQHEGGERADWDDNRLTRRGDHPMVWPSAGSHASYFSQDLYLGRSASEGFGCDDAGGPARAIEPRAVALPDAVDDAAHPLAWLSFDGRWGERQSGPFNGPTGPTAKERWTTPVDWHDNLRRSSVAVPVDVDSGTAGVAVFCGAVEWGSETLILLKLNPEIIVLGVLLIGFLLSFAFRRTDWTPVSPLPLRRRRRAGQIVGAAWRTYTARPLRFAAVSLIYLPISLLVGAVVVALGRMPLVGPAIESDRDLGPVGTFFALLLGSAGHVVGLIVAVAVVALMMRGIEDGEEPTPGAMIDRLRSERGDLASSIVRAAAIVVGLLVSIVGIPWAIRQTVRYQFVPQSSALESHGGRSALARSSELVRGRWLHTAIVIILLNAAAGVAASLMAMVLLLTLTGIPLWLFSIIVTLASGAIVPFAAIALVLLFGDAVAEDENLPAADITTQQAGVDARPADART